MGWGDQGGCDRIIKDFGKIQKKIWGGGRGGGDRVTGVRMDLKEELKFSVKIQKKKNWGGGGSRIGVRLGGGQGGCERRIEVLGKIHKKKFGGGGFRLGVRVV